MPLRTHIENGQTVEVITAKNAQPNPNWVNFVVTAKARASIRQHLKNQRYSEALDLGRRLLDQALRDSGTPLRKIKDAQMQSLLDEFGLNNTNELFGQIGLGQRLAPLVAKALLQAPDHRRNRTGQAHADRHRRHRGPGGVLRALLSSDSGG